MTVHNQDILAAPAAERVLCDHCGLPVPAGLIEAQAQHQFCCGGCRAVFETIHACDLTAYYKLRDTAGKAAPAAVSGGRFEAFDTPAFANLYVRQLDENLATADLMLEGVTCAACVWLVEKLPKLLGGVVEARLSLREATVRVTWESERVKLSQVAQALDRLGYTPHPAKGISRRDLQMKEERKRLVHLGVAGAIMGNTMLLGLALYAGAFGGIEDEYKLFLRWISALLGTIALAWPGATFFRSAITALRARSVNLDVPIALALLAGGAAGLYNTILNRGEIYFDSLTVLVFLLLVGRWLQYRQQRKADAAVDLLFSLTPSSCRIVRDGTAHEMPIEALAPGDLTEVRAGELIPADGLVESGESAVNQALLTGESLPAAVRPGDRVYAASMNVASVLRVRVDSIGQETRVGRLMQLVERGVADKPAIVQFADRVGLWFVVVVSLLAAGTFAYWSRYSMADAIDHAVALLIVTCPCVLGLATPLTIAVAMGRMARESILIKSGAAIERISRGGRLLLDKTGTLTHGALTVLGWWGDQSVRGVVAEIEANSNHPIARALVAAMWHGHPARDSHNADGTMSGDPPSPGVPGEGGRAPLRGDTIIEKGDGGISAMVDGREYRIGSPMHMERHSVSVPAELEDRRKAIEGEAATAVFIAVDGVAVAVAALGDRIREDSAACVLQLRRMGFSPQIISGDAQGVVDAVAAGIGIEPDRAHGQILPEEKLARVRDGAGPTVMVGDGVNDAAALAAADVGIAVHGSAETSLAAADIYIARPGLGGIVELVDSSRRTMRIIRRNLAVSLAYNVLAGSLAMMGLMSPMLAAIIMPVSSATVLSLAAAALAKRKRGAACP